MCSKMIVEWTFINVAVWIIYEKQNVLKVLKLKMLVIQNRPCQCNGTAILLLMH